MLKVKLVAYFLKFDFFVYKNVTGLGSYNFAFKNYSRKIEISVKLVAPKASIFEVCCKLKGIQAEVYKLFRCLYFTKYMA